LKGIKRKEKGGKLDIQLIKDGEGMDKQAEKWIKES
jgi:hypothetical protein